MRFEAPRQPSIEEMAKIEKERTLSDAELLKGRAEYKFDEKKNKILEATDEQVEKIKQEKLAEKFIELDAGFDNNIIVGSARVTISGRDAYIPSAQHIEKGDIVKLYNDKNYIVLGFTPKDKHSNVVSNIAHLKEISDTEAKDIKEKKEKFNELLEVGGLIHQYSELNDKHYRTRNIGNEKEKLKTELLEIQNKIDETVAHALNMVGDLRLNIEDKRKLAGFITNNYRRYLYGKEIKWEKSEEWTNAIEITSKILTDGADTFSVKESNRLTELNKKGVFGNNLTANEKYEETYLKHKKERIMQILNQRWYELKYKPFDPQLELRKVRYFSKEEIENISPENRKRIQKKRLSEYKEQLLIQKKEIAEIQINLEKEIRSNPDVSFKDLMESLDSKAPGAKLTNNQINIFEKGLYNYTLAHQDIKYNRQEYPDDDKLFKACFGSLPKGKVEIIKGPMTFYFRCHNIEDYALIHSGKLDSEKSLDEHDITSANMSGGVKTSKSLIPYFKGVIMAENSLGRSVNKETYIHEEQHAIQQLFEDERARQDIFMSGMEKSSVKEQEKILVNSLRRKREDFESRVKDEILAYFKDGTDTEQIKQTLLTKKDDGGLYDYFKKWFLDTGKAERDELINGGLNSDFVDKTFSKIFITEYRDNVINPAVEAILALNNNGLTKEKIINLLINEPLSKWPKVVERMKKV